MEFVEDVDEWGLEATEVVVKALGLESGNSGYNQHQVGPYRVFLRIYFEPGWKALRAVVWEAEAQQVVRRILPALRVVLEGWSLDKLSEGEDAARGRASVSAGRREIDAEVRRVLREG